MQRAADAEDAIRRYLVYLDHPSKLVDQAAVKRQAERTRGIADPIERLHAFAELERIRTVDGSAVLAAFVEVARAWAGENQIPAAAFRELGVPDSALEAAGFETPRRGGRRVRTPRVSVPAAQRPRGRSKAVIAEIQEVMRAFAEPFTLSDVAAKTGGSAATVRKAAELLCSSGDLVKRGPDPDHSARGRAPFLYAMSR